MSIINKCKGLCEHPNFEKLIICAVFINAIFLGIEVSLSLTPSMTIFFQVTEVVFMTLFCSEIFLKMIYFKGGFFKDPWRFFDFMVVSLALIPSSGPLSILRAFRVLRALRMISVVPRLRQVVVGLMGSLPGAVGSIIILVFYVAAVMATTMFGSVFHDWFGSIPSSAYSLFQIMTLESWSMGIVRPVMQEFPWAWMFFIPFICVTTFIMLNLMIAVIVSSMQGENVEAAAEVAQSSHDERKELLLEIKTLQEQMTSLNLKVDSMKPSTLHISEQNIIKQSSKKGPEIQPPLQQ